MCFCRCPCGVWICFFGRIWFWEILALRGFIYELLLLCWLVCVEIWIFVIVKGCNFEYSQVDGSKHLIKKNIVYWWCSSTTCEFKVARADRCLLLRLNLISMVFLFCYHQMKHNTKTERRFRKKKLLEKVYSGILFFSLYVLFSDFDFEQWLWCCGSLGVCGILIQ